MHHTVAEVDCKKKLEETQQQIKPVLPFRNVLKTFVATTVRLMVRRDQITELCLIVQETSTAQTRLVIFRQGL